MPGKPTDGSARSADADDQVLRFTRALRQAMVINRCSERKLAAMLGITIGTTQKYFRGEVMPLRVSTEVTQKLAALLGVSCDSLLDYYSSGEYTSGLTAQQVIDWLRSGAAKEHLASLLGAMQRGVEEMDHACRGREKPQPYTWPSEELALSGISDAMRERLGLTGEAVKRLEETGEFTAEMVEGFSLVCDIDEDQVRDAWTRRVRISREASE